MAVSDTSLPHPYGATLSRRLLDSRTATRGLALAILAFGLVTIGTGFINHDVAWYYYAAGRVLDGARLYVDIVDPNPPLVYYLNMPAVWAARLLGLGTQLAFDLYMLALIGLSLVLWWRIANVAEAPETPAARRLMLLVLLVMLFPFYDFGQREHLTVIFVLPYVFGVAGRARGRPLDARLMLVAGALAALALSIKPFYLSLWPLFEAYLILVCRAGPPWRRPENLAFIGTVGLYAASVPLLTPEYFSITLMTLQIYSGYNAPFWKLALSVWFCLNPVALSLWWRLRPGAPHRALGDTLALLAAGTLVMGMGQGKGWSYHLYPNLVATVLCITLALIEAYARRLAAPRTLERLGLAGVLLLLAVPGTVLGARLLGHDLVHPNNPLPELIRVVRAHTHPGDYIYLASTGIFPSFPLVNYTDTRWATAIQPLWMLPGLYSGEERETTPFPYHSQAQMTAIEAYMLSTTVDDLVRHRPAVIIIEIGRKKDGLQQTSFDYVDYLSRQPGFAKLWEQYELVTTAGSYQVYRRRG